MIAWITFVIQKMFSLFTESRKVRSSSSDFVKTNQIVIFAVVGCFIIELIN